jgi:hypothetical protein
LKLTCCFERGSTVEKANVSEPPSQATTVPTRAAPWNNKIIINSKKEWSNSFFYQIE